MRTRLGLLDPEFLEGDITRSTDQLDDYMNASDNDVNKMYKKLALELHPDKGGDPEKFQELVEMKDRLNEAEKDDDEKKKEEDADDEEAKKAKEKEREEEEKQRLPPDERIKKLRMEVHDNTVRLWERAKRSR